MFVWPVACAPTGRWPSVAAMTEFGTCHVAVIADDGCERSTVLTSTSIFGTVYVTSPRSVVCHGSTLLQPRGLGPVSTPFTTLLYMTETAQSLTLPRPV